MNNKEESKQNLKGSDHSSEVRKYLFNFYKASITSEKENEKLDNSILSEQIEEVDLKQDLFDVPFHPYSAIDENDESYKDKLKVKKEYICLVKLN